MAEEKSNRTVVPGRKKTAESARNFWVVTVEQGTKREDLKRPEFWSLVSADFRPYDRIEVRCDDGTFFAEFVVLSCDRTWARVHELIYCLLGTQDVSLSEAAILEARGRYKVEWRGPHLKFCVERKDGENIARVQQELPDKVAATVWLENHLKTVGA